MGYQKSHSCGQGLTPSSTVIYLLATALLAGCGGGSSPTPSTSSAVAITQQNSSQVTGASYQSVQSAQDSSSAGAATFASVVVSGGHRTPSLTGFARRQIIRLEGMDYSAAADLAVSAVATLNLPCDTPSGGTAGSISVKLNDADGNNTFSTGDTVEATFTNCYSATDGQTTDGGFSLTGFTITGDPQIAGTAWNATATFTFTNLSITDATGTNAVDGDFTFSGSTADGITTTGTLSGTSLAVKQSSGPTLTLQNYSITGIVNSNTTVVSVYGSGRVTDSSLNGYIDFQISASTPLVASGALDPSSGAMTITGANNSSIKLTVISSTSVQLQVDENGDGTAETTVTKSWSEISA